MGFTLFNWADTFYVQKLKHKMTKAFIQLFRFIYYFVIIFELFILTFCTLSSSNSLLEIYRDRLIIFNLLSIYYDCTVVEAFWSHLIIIISNFYQCFGLASRWSSLTLMHAPSDEPGCLETIWDRSHPLEEFARSVLILFKVCGRNKYVTLCMMIVKPWVGRNVRTCGLNSMLLWLVILLIY